MRTSNQPVMTSLESSSPRPASRSTSGALRIGFLRGRHHQSIGRLELEGIGPAAVALSRGGARKTYSHTDPNEDCVAFALGRGGQLAVVADGHHGEHGSEAAVRTVLERYAARWTDERDPAGDESAWRREAISALLDANRAILDVAGRSELPPAPTTFAFALLRPADDRCLHVSVGDSHVFWVDRGGATDLGGRDPDLEFTPFLGYEQAEPELLERYASIDVRKGIAELRACVLATDGLSEPGIGVADPAAAAASAVAQAELDAPPGRRAVDTCRQVVETALASQRRQKAGDNIGCAVLWVDRHD